MGFDPENAAAALKECNNNLERALELLISGYTASSLASVSSSMIPEVHSRFGNYYCLPAHLLEDTKNLKNSMDEDIARQLAKEEEEQVSKRYVIR